MSKVYEADFPYKEIRKENGDLFQRISSAEIHAKRLGYGIDNVWAITDGEGAWCYGLSSSYVNLLGYIVSDTPNQGEVYIETFETDEEE